MIKYLLILITPFLLINNAFADGIDIEKIVTEKQEVIGTFKMLGTNRAIYSIPEWKYNQMKEKGFNDMQIIHYNIINTLECGIENGSCLSSADSGPFQINQIHKEDYKYSKFLINNEDYDTLYQFQLNWTYNRMEGLKDRFCKGTENQVFRCMLKNHNGNVAITKNGTQFRDEYADSGLKIKEIILKLVKI